jgi:hypothetical protein
MRFQKWEKTVVFGKDVNKIMDSEKQPSADFSLKLLNALGNHCSHMVNHGRHLIQVLQFFSLLFHFPDLVVETANTHRVDGGF